MANIVGNLSIPDSFGGVEKLVQIIENVIVLYEEKMDNFDVEMIFLVRKNDFFDILTDEKWNYTKKILIYQYVISLRGTMKGEGNLKFDNYTQIARQFCTWKQLR